MTVTASAPATTANLGPGFDCLAMALEPRCVVTAVATDRWEVVHIGSEPLPEGQPDRVLQGAMEVSERPLRLTVDSTIPIGKGLGSSAAALVAGVAVGLEVGGRYSREAAYFVSTRLEGHPDQVAAATYGGLVLIGPDGAHHALSLHSSLRVLVAVPQQTLATSLARSLVEREQPLEVVVRSLARVSALTAGLLTGDRELLGAASGDEIHEQPRAAVSPVVGELMEAALRAGAWHAARSGAGPSVVAFCGAGEVEGVAGALRHAGASVIDAPIDTRGLEVSVSV